MNINYEKLKNDLIDYFGTAMSFNPIAIMNVSEVKNATYDKLIQIAVKNGFNLNDYIVKTKNR